MKRKPDTEIAEQDWNGTTTYKKFGGKFEKKFPRPPPLCPTPFFEKQNSTYQKNVTLDRKNSPLEKNPPLRCTELQDLIRYC